MGVFMVVFKALSGFIATNLLLMFAPATLSCSVGVLGLVCGIAEGSSGSMELVDVLLQMHCQAEAGHAVCHI